MRRLITALLCLSLAAILPAVAADDAPKMSAQQFLSSLTFREGKVQLPGDIATLDLPPTFRYLDPADAGKLLSEGWGNPPGAKTLGMIVPADVNLLSAAGWGVVVTYDKDGHVKDDDADTINYADLLKDIQEGMIENNKARKEQGYAPMTLVGWAEQPSYDKSQHKLYWAKELHTEGDNENGLNYNIRVLGREGVLVLNAVSGMNQIAQVKTEMKKVTAFTDFTPGNRYSDFNAGTDKVAEYGIAALVAGGVAAKLGFFGKIFALLLAFKKIILIGVAAIGSWVYKLLGRKREEKAAAVDLSKPE
ncbi:Uncharacterized membrane-anchored protein [Duganella sp. CF402]|uniref:DUF2167 domain-containing protein n=1 Tax=unclassified Duganella TaxID=2636909 RepID=UPI0008AB4DBE|nr:MULTISPECIES: DUF2167 domain-containing protein [unclassified Duganella]RZT06276.1 putative membrane-anchored protein [Duganella sp. BK701]SEM69507.1 Uncharacterized membrane-anchored protein [Duganella sp. CF402]